MKRSLIIVQIFHTDTFSYALHQVGANGFDCMSVDQRRCLTNGLTTLNNTLEEFQQLQGLFALRTASPAWEKAMEDPTCRCSVLRLGRKIDDQKAELDALVSVISEGEGNVFKPKFRMLLGEEERMAGFWKPV